MDSRDKLVIRHSGFLVFRYRTKGVNLVRDELAFFWDYNDAVQFTMTHYDILHIVAKSYP